MKVKLTVFLIILIGVNCFSQSSRTSKPEKQKVPNINLDNFIEFAPSISADGRTMIFESNRNKGWKLFETQLDENGNWSEPISIRSINDFGRKTDLIAGPNISYDGNYLYFFGFFMLRTESEDIFVSTRQSDGWSEPVPIGDPINSNGYEGFPSVSSDDQTLYFIRVNEDNPKYEGTEEPCFEIWSSTKDIDDNWQEPVKLPAPINMGCERSPKILADGQTLLFSSIREGGVGLYDMYQSTMLEDGTWSSPISLDFVNTSENDLSPCISASGDLMYYYSNDDIYQVPIPPKYRQYKNITVDGIVMDFTSKSPLKTHITIRDKSTNEVKSRLINNPDDGWYSIVLTKGVVYTIEFASQGYLPRTYEFDLTQLEEYREEHLDVLLNDKLKLSIKIIDAELLTPEKANVEISTLGGQKLAVLGNTENFELQLAMSDKYLFSINAPNYHQLLDTITLSSESSFEIDRQYRLKPKKVNVIVEVFDLNNNQKVKSKLKFKNNNKDELLEVNSDESIGLRSGARYEVESSSDGYFFGSTEIVVDELIAGPDGIYRMSSPIYVTQIAVNSSLVLKGIQFDTNSAQLTQDSQAELERIISLLIGNPGIKVEIAAHTDNVGDASYNLNLSLKRAESVVNFLTENKIAKEILVPRGYGMTKPAVSNDSEVNRAKNRRVEMRILSVDN